MILDNKEQREILLGALMTVEIKGDYNGLSEMFPKMQAVVKAVQDAEVAKEGQDASNAESKPD